MDHSVFKLSNGIRLIHKPTSSTIAHACVIINSGSRDEKENEVGLAHFIEHLLFKRTKKRNTTQILSRLENVGADLNAYTTKEYMCIHASFLKIHLTRTLDLFEDIIFNSTFPEEEIEKEKSVILDEIASYQDQPEESIQDDFEDLLFEGHSLGRNILGSPQTVNSFKRNDLVDFTEKSHAANDLIIGVYGNYEPKLLIRTAEKIFGKKNVSSSSRKRNAVLSYKTKHQTVIKPISQTHTVIGTQTYSHHHPNKTGLLLLSNLLGGNGMSSRLNLQIREKYGIAYTIESNYAPLSDTGIFSIYFGTDEEKSKRATSLVYKELKKLRNQKLGSIQLHQAKHKLTGQIALGEENRMGLIISMAKSLLDYNRVDSIEQVYEKINGVTAAQLLEIANEVFDEACLTSLTFFPQQFV